MYSIIPENYLETGVVPICISHVDNFGRPVFKGWIEAVPRIAEPVRNLARKIGDVWLSSQLAEESVHKLSANHGEVLGPAPSSAIYIEASWRAAHMIAGGRREREGLNIRLHDVMLACLREPYDFARAYEDAEYFERVLEELQRRGMVDVERIVKMYLADAEDQIPAAFGIEKKASKAWQTLCKRFLRGIRRAAGSL
jgi:hypothetical protein